MPISAIEFTDAELDLIKTIVDSDAGWGCDLLDPLRRRIKQFYLAGQGLRCCYCRRQLASTHGRAWDIEHVIAQAGNPDFMFEPENLAVACIDCNAAKSDEDVLDRPRRRFPRVSEAYRIVHPHYDEWTDHFALGQVVYAPKSAKGAHTITVCKLYRYYDLVGQDALFADDRRFADLAEQVLFAKTAADALPPALAISAMVQLAVADETAANAALNRD